jgi:GH25 family lysozyme M1 (1,4-beta-N-acetylmuramidase)
MSKYQSLADLYQVIDYHGYTLDQIRQGAAIVKEYFPIKPTCLSEWNQCDAASVFSLDIEAVSRCYFLLGGSTDQTQYDILKLPTIYASFKSWPEVVPIPEPLPVPQPIPTEVKMMQVIDVSNHQRSINWALVGQCGPPAAIIKASEGTNYVDPYFVANWQGAKANGINRTAYHFGRPSSNSGHQEAHYFLSVVSDIQVGDSLALDLEDDLVSPTAGLLAYTLDFLQTIEASLGFKPLLYSSNSYLSEHGCIGSQELAQYGLWIADWQTSQFPATPSPWSVVALWQYGSGPVPGIQGAVDLSVFNGSLDQLKKYGKLG